MSMRPFVHALRLRETQGLPAPFWFFVPVPVHWHEIPEFIRARARDKGIDLGGDGHRHRLVTKRDVTGAPL